MNWGHVMQDICDTPCDAVVNAANSSLLGGGGVDGAIHAAAGSHELGDYILRFVPRTGTDPLDPSCGIRCNYGDVVITPSFGMKNCKAIIHTVGPIWHGGGRGEARILAGCYWKSLELAKAWGFKTIAFPCISAGCYRFPLGIAADVAVRTVRKWLVQNNDAVRVLFVTYTDEAAEKYEELLDFYGNNRKRGAKS